MVKTVKVAMKSFMHPLETVVEAYNLRYQNPELVPFFLGSDLLSEQHKDGVTEVVRRCYVQIEAPFIIRKIVGKDYLVFQQSYRYDSKKRTMCTEGVNESFVDRLTLNESCLFRVHPDNPDWTALEQMAQLNITSALGMESLVEKVAMRQYQRNLDKTKNLIDNLVTQMKDTEKYASLIPKSYPSQNSRLLGTSTPTTKSEYFNPTPNIRDSKSKHQNSSFGRLSKLNSQSSVVQIVDSIGAYEKNRNKTSSIHVTRKKSSSLKVQELKAPNKKLKKSQKIQNKMIESPVVKRMAYLSHLNQGKPPTSQHELHFETKRESVKQIRKIWSSKKNKVVVVNTAETAESVESVESAKPAEVAGASMLFSQINLNLPFYEADNIEVANIDMHSDRLDVNSSNAVPNGSVSYNSAVSTTKNSEKKSKNYKSSNKNLFQKVRNLFRIASSDAYNCPKSTSQKALVLVEVKQLSKKQSSH